jgi:hypothetical protein
MERKFYLLSIILNQQARLELQKLRRRLFRELGLASALAFEPIIPLAWCSERPDSAAFARFAGPEDLDRAAGGPARGGPPKIATGGLKRVGDALFLEATVSPEHALESLLTPLSETPAQKGNLFGLDAPPGLPGLPRPFFPVTPGIFLAAREFGAAAETAAMRCADWAPAQQSWTSSRIGLFSVSSATEPWWQGVEWGLEWKIQLKQV